MEDRDRRRVASSCCGCRGVLEAANEGVNDVSGFCAKPNFFRATYFHT
jgi:hypothetical protein